MCCEEPRTFDLPPEVIEALATYRLQMEASAWDWGQEGAELFRLGRLFLPLVTALTAGQDLLAAIEGVFASLPSDLVLLTVGEGVHVRRPDPALAAIAGRDRSVDLVFRAGAGAAGHVHLSDDVVDLGMAGIAARTVTLGPDRELTGSVDSTPFVVEGVVEDHPPATLRLRSSVITRWSVVDAGGGAWFPAGALEKWDGKGRPFFHGCDVELEVPATTLHVRCTRGLEYDVWSTAVAPEAGTTVEVIGEPRRLIDPAADGWYGADLHVHLNYSGDLVCEPAQAAMMQLGEGLHLMNLTAANMLHATVYDRELLDAYAGEPLPWSDRDHLAAMGVEYRNDLLGHVHALAPAAPPSRFHSGHEGAGSEDWPPNAVAIEELQSLDATVGYCHPVLGTFEDGSTDRFFAMPRSTECRELVADAAVGRVDSIDLIAPTNHDGATYLYHQLLSCGLRLAPSAGTDAFLSFSRTTPHSNPPGWGRVYARVDGELSLPAFKQAVRSGHTVVTNGPWLDFTVDGQGPGAMLDVAHGAVVTLRAEASGTGAERLLLVGADGIIAEGPADRVLEVGVAADRPTWVAAMARGGPHDEVLDRSAFAHTAPVQLDVDGDRVRRTAAAEWCLGLLDGLEDLIRTHGHFHEVTREEHLGDHLDLLAQARDRYRAIAAVGN